MVMRLVLVCLVSIGIGLSGSFALESQQEVFDELITGLRTLDPARIIQTFDARSREIFQIAEEVLAEENLSLKIVLTRLLQKDPETFEFLRQGKARFRVLEASGDEKRCEVRVETVDVGGIIKESNRSIPMIKEDGVWRLDLVRLWENERARQPDNPLLKAPLRTMSNPELRALFRSLLPLLEQFLLR